MSTVRYGHSQPDVPSPGVSPGIKDHDGLELAQLSSHSRGGNFPEDDKAMSQLHLNGGDPLKGKHEGPYKKHVQRLPYFRTPLKSKDGPWLEEGNMATVWLTLFYDLVVAAVLSSFSTTHELATPKAVPIFLSYFVVIWWVWVSQIHYDARFQAEDAWHRFVKALQLVVFVYIGGASGNWDPGKLRDPSTMSGITVDVKIQHSEAGTSFHTVLIAFAISRAMLIIQYGVCCLLSRRARRPLKPFYLPLATISASLILTIIADVIPANSTAMVVLKNVFFYLGIIVEVCGAGLAAFMRDEALAKVDVIGERYGGFTLIILGEGFISLVRSFNYALSGLSQDDGITYAQVFAAVGIMFLLWYFLFADFKPKETIGPRRGFVWEAIHLPLHFALLLLIAAIVNAIVVLAFAHGVDVTSSSFQNTLESISNGTLPSAEEQDKAASIFGVLQLQPPYPEEMDYINSLLNTTTPSGSASVIAYQYLGQIMAATIQIYGLKLTDEENSIIGKLNNLDSTYTTNKTISEETLQEAGTLILDLIIDPVQEALGGISWLYPAAGITLILCAIRSMLWHRFRGFSHYIIHGMLIMSGVALSLLGCLDIGDQKVIVDSQGNIASQSPLFALLNAGVPLIPVFLTYLFTMLLSSFALRLLHKRVGGVYSKDEI